MPYVSFVPSPTDLFHKEYKPRDTSALYKHAGEKERKKKGVQRPQPFPRSAIAHRTVNPVWCGHSKPGQDQSCSSEPIVLPPMRLDTTQLTPVRTRMFVSPDTREQKYQHARSSRIDV